MDQAKAKEITKLIQASFKEAKARIAQPDISQAVVNAAILGNQLNIMSLLGVIIQDMADMQEEEKADADS